MLDISGMACYNLFINFFHRKGERKLKHFKRIASVFLAAAILFCCIPMSASAADDLRTKDLREYPVIQMAGSISPLFYDDNGVDGETAFDFGWLASAFSQVDLMGPLQKLDLKGVVYALGEAIKIWFGNIQMLPDGTSVNEISRRGQWWCGNNWTEETVLNSYTPGQRIDVWYNFDWRGDPSLEADKLKDYIDLVKAKTGAEKVNLVAISGSGQIAMAYLAKYKQHYKDNLASAVFNISLHNGNSAFGQLALGEVRLDASALGYTQLFAMMDMPDLQNQLATTLKWLYESGVMDMVVNAFNLFSAVMKSELYNKYLIPYLFTLPNMWNYVPMEYYEKAKKALFADKPEYNDFLLRSDWYHNQVMAKSGEILQEAAETIKVAQWAGYNMPLMPFGKDTSVHSDSFVDTQYASNGATCAELGCTFPFWYKQRETCCGKNHISADRMIDASTCALPDQTWFSKNEYHQEERGYSGWFDWFLATPNPTVFTDVTKYPQFMEMVSLWNYQPVKAQEVTFLSVLKDIGYWLLKVWRFILTLPMFWVRWV